MCRRTLRTLFVTLALSLIGQAVADIPRWAYTYGWNTPFRGELELEFRNHYLAKGKKYRGEYELEYGVTDRWVVSPYLIVEHNGGWNDPPGLGEDDDEGGGTLFNPLKHPRRWRVQGYKIEQRYRFGDRKDRTLPALYLEYKNERDTSPEIEGKLILQYEDRGRLFGANVILENEAGQKLKPEWGYSLGYADLNLDKKGQWWFGAEAFGNINEHFHWAGPTVGVVLNEHLRFVATYGKALTKGDDRAQFLISYQF